jgi:hypothetical protein
MSNILFKNYILTKTNPYQSIEQYKIFFKNKFFGIHFNDDNLEDLIENYFPDSLTENFNDTNYFEFDFIINDLFSWDECLISSVDLIKLEFLDIKIDTCVLSLLATFEKKQQNNLNKFFLDFKSLYLHSNCLFFATLNNYYFMFLFNQIIKKNLKKKHIITKLFKYNFKYNFFIIYISNINKFYNIKFSLIFYLFFYDIFFNYKIIKNLYIKQYSFNFKLDLLSKNIINLYLNFFKKLKKNKKIIKNITKLNLFNFKSKKLISFTIKPFFWYYISSTLFFHYFKFKNLKYSMLELQVLKWKFQIKKKKTHKNLSKTFKFISLKKISKKTKDYEKKINLISLCKSKYNLYKRFYKKSNVKNFIHITSFYSILNQFFLKSQYSLLFLKKIKKLKKNKLHFNIFNTIYFLSSFMEIKKEINSLMKHQFIKKKFKNFLFKIKIVTFKIDNFLVYYQIIKKLNK